MSSEESFMKAILEAPDDDALRLVYADWLEERGDPRGEFIRIQIARADAEGDTRTNHVLLPREKELRGEHGGVWAGPVRDLVSNWEFHRGLLEEVTINARSFIEKGEVVLRLAPFVRRVRLRDSADVMPELAASPLLARIRDLDLVGDGLDDLAAEMLANSEHVGSLHVLRLRMNGLQTDAVRALARSPNLSALVELDLAANDIGDLGLQALCAGGKLPCLQRLDLTSCGLTDTGVRALAGSPFLGQLRALHLGGNTLRMTGLRALAGSARTAGLQTLSLDASDFNSLAAQTIAGSPHLAKLTRLYLQLNHITDGGADALVQSAHLTQLHELDLRDNPIGQSARQRLRARFGDQVWF
jgi:uncharacterized protein (TIGR02996 family)